MQKGVIRLLLPAAVIALVAGGCGTTAPVSQQRTLSRGGAAANHGVAGGSGGSEETVVGGSGVSSGGVVSGTGSGLGGSSSGGGGAGASPTGGAGSGPTSVGAGTSPAGRTGPGGIPQAGDGPGVTATTINVGLLNDTDAAAEDAAVGFANISPGNVPAETNAMVSYINAHGGVAHRKVNVIWYNYGESENANQIQQGACSEWTQDNKTFVLETGLPIFDQCAADEGAIGLYQAFLAETTPTLQHYSEDIDQDGFTIDRGDRATIDGLAAQGYFSTGAKVGIATWDENDYQYGITNGVDPALAKFGIHNVPVQYVTVPESYADLGATSSSVASAVLKFHSEGIDHVILLDGPAGVNNSGVLVIEWLNQANSQRYYPKYGLNSTSGFSAATSDYPEQEMVGSVGVGWLPSEDLATGDYDALPQTANQKECTKIMAAAGEAPTNSNQESTEFTICDEFFFLQYALGKVTGPLNQQAALTAIDSVGSSFSDLTTFGTFYSASQHDGAELIRNISFVPSCTCYRYSSAAYNPG